MSFARGVTVTTKTAEAPRLAASFEIAPVNALVQKATLTLASMQTGVDAIASAESRAKAVLRRVTRPFGNDGSTWFTKIATQPVIRGVAAATGLVAAGTVLYLTFPESGDHWNASNWRHIGHMVHRTANTWYLWDVAQSVAGTLIAGAIGAFGREQIVKRTTRHEKARMARALLGADHLKTFVQLAEAARERPLERAAIAKVARETLESLNERQVFRSPEVKSILGKAAADEGLGNVTAREGVAHHRALIDAPLAAETNRGNDIDSRIRELRAALDALPMDERAAVANDIYDRLFDNFRPRQQHIGYGEAQVLTDMLRPASANT
jgi:hypothetical protein